MELNGYRVEIIGGRHIKNFGQNQDNSYVELKDGDHYKVKIGNNLNRRCHANIIIDGKSMGTWVLDKYQTFAVERPSNVDKKFTFFLVNSQGGISSGLVANNVNNGLVQVEFIPEREQLFPALCRERPYSDVEEVKDIMIKNIDRMLDEHERCENLECRTSDLSLQSHRIKSSSLGQSNFFERYMPFNSSTRSAAHNQDRDRRGCGNNSSRCAESFESMSLDDDNDVGYNLKNESMQLRADTVTPKVGSGPWNQKAQDSYKQGGTGLQGKSFQSFRHVAPLDLDNNKKVTISLRLVGKEGKEGKEGKVESPYNKVSPLSNVPTANPVPPLLY